MLANGRVVRVGTDDDIRGLASSETEVVDLEGRTVIPGLIDAHAHLLSLGLVFRVINARYPEIQTLAELVRAVEARAGELPEGEWVRGRGFDYAKYPEARMPTRWDLDPITDSHPVFLVHVTGHHALVNTRALELAGIDDDVEDPRGGQFVRDAAGRLTGMLLDAAIQRVAPMAVDVENHGPNHLTFLAPGEDLVQDIDKASRAFVEAGVTTVVDPQVTRREMSAYIEARLCRRLNVRIHAMYLSNHLQDLIALGLSSTLGDDRLSIGPMKIYCDGALLGSSADFYEPYRDDVDRRSRFWTKVELAELIGTAHAFGLQVGVHAQGDRAISDTVAAIAHAQEGDGDIGRRHRLEHCGCPRLTDLDRMAQLGAIPVNQPGFVYQAGDELSETLGDRAVPANAAQERAGPRAAPCHQLRRASGLACPISQYLRGRQPPDRKRPTGGRRRASIAR